MTGATLMLNRLRLRMNARLSSIPTVPGLLVGIVLVLLLSTFAVRELFGGGVILTGDTLHALRLRGMHECIADGQIPCRWVPNMGRGYGYPLFNYYPPLPYYAGELFRHIFGFSYIGTVDVLYITGLLSAGVSMFLLTRKLWGDLGGLVSAVAFVYAPYLALDTYMRGALVELWAIAVTPALLWAIYELITSERLRFVPIAALFLAFLLLSHNLMAIIMAPAIVLWTAFLLLTRGRRAWRPTLLGAAALVWGLGLAAFFTLPVLTQGDDVQLDRLALTADGEALLYPRNFVTVNDLFLQRTDDYSLLLGVGEDTPIQIGWFHWALAGLALPAGLLYLRAKRWRSALAVLVFSVAFGIGVFMSVSKSRVMWDQFDTLRFLQFPWRYMGLVSLASAGLAGAWLGLLRHRALWLQLVVAAVLLAIFIAGGEAFFRPFYRCSLTPHRSIACPASDAEIFALDREARAIYDYLPVLVERLPDAPPKRPAQIVEGEGNVLGAVQGSNWMRLQVDIKGSEPALVGAALYEFPEWRVEVDGKPVTHGPSFQQGLVLFHVPPGVHQVDVQLKDTFVRRWANRISFVSWMALVLALPLLLPNLPLRRWYSRLRGRSDER